LFQPLSVPSETLPVSKMSPNCGMRMWSVLSLILTMLVQLAAQGTPDTSFDAIYQRGLRLNAELKTLTAGFTETTTSEMLARPLNWESNEEPPQIHVTPPKEGQTNNKPKKLKFAQAISDSDQEKNEIAKAIDGKAETGWSPDPKTAAEPQNWLTYSGNLNGQRHSALFPSFAQNA